MIKGTLMLCFVAAERSFGERRQQSFLRFDRETRNGIIFSIDGIYSKVEFCRGEFSTKYFQAVIVISRQSQSTSTWGVTLTLTTPSRAAFRKKKLLRPDRRKKVRKNNQNKKMCCGFF